MSNSWFRFKEFTVIQDSTAMKVGTDGVLLGAWFDVSGAQRILDIGTGTGLIALMAAQRVSPALVTAIETDPDACRQAEENFSRSPWGSRIKIVEGSVFNFFPKEKYDTLLCNPPFFKNALKNPDRQKAEARHCSATFSHAELIEHACKHLLADGGALSLILPVTEAEDLIPHAVSTGFHLSRMTEISSAEGGRAIRVLMEFRIKCNGPCIKDSMYLYHEDHSRSLAYKILTKDFYL